MKSILFSFLLLIGIQTSAQVSIGLVGFPQITNLTSKSLRKDPVMNNKLSFGGGGGVTLTYGFSDKFGVQVGAFYSAQLQKIKSTYTIAGQSNTWESGKHFHYLKIPVLLRIVQPLGNMNFVLFAGPQFSYLLRYDGGMIVYIKDQYFDLPHTPSGNNYFKKYTIDAVVGAALEFPMSPTLDLTTALKIDYNVTNAQNKEATYNGMKVSDMSGGGTARNATYALLLGINYKFRNANYLIAPTNKFRKKSYGKKKRY